jgi:hypothetical protein
MAGTMARDDGLPDAAIILNGAPCCILLSRAQREDRLGVQK